MSIWSTVVNEYRRGFTSVSPTSLSIARLSLALRDQTLEVGFDLQVENWNGDPVQLVIEIVSVANVTIEEVRYQIRPDWPCWNVTIPDLVYAVPVAPKVECYARVTLRDCDKVLATTTSTVEPEQPRASKPRRRRRASVLCPEEKLLGLAHGYSAADLKAAFRRAISRWHPDRFASSSAARRDAATARAQRIIEAHAILEARLVRS